jgi:uncharacterized protein
MAAFASLFFAPSRGVANNSRLPCSSNKERRMSATADHPLALITGASSGIGFELARQFAENGFDLIIAAEDDELAVAKRDLEAAGARIQAVQVDLATEAGVTELYRQVRATARPLAAAALNAGRGAGGAFATDTKLEDELEIVDLNVRSTVQLAKYIIGDMVSQNAGRILFTSSIASTMPGPFQAVYNASKSFVQSFALALRNELKDTGVSVTSLMPGPVDTEFFKRAGMDQDTKVGTGDKDDPVDVARDGFEALMNGDERVVSHSLSSKIQGIGSRVLPDSVKAEMHRKMAEPGSAD